MVCWVAERAQAAANVDRVIVATDSQQIIDAVESLDIEAILTAPDHTSGTDRVAEVAAQIPEAKIIVNVQGDEPLISPATIERAVDTMAAEIAKPNGAGIVTTWEPIESIDDLLNPDLVKVVLDENDHGSLLLTFTDPVSARRREEARFARSCTRKRTRTVQAVSQAHRFVRLSQRRAFGVYKVASISARTGRSTRATASLAHGVKIKVVEACTASTGVDTFEDLERVRELIGPRHLDLRTQTV